MKNYFFSVKIITPIGNDDKLLCNYIEYLMNILCTRNNYIIVNTLNVQFYL